MPYEVQLYTSHRTWKNALISERDGFSPARFATRFKAQAALDELLADIYSDAWEGFCPPWQPEDLRIEFVADGSGDTDSVFEDFSDILHVACGQRGVIN